MTRHIHTAGAGNINLPWYGNPSVYLDDNEIDVSEALVLDDTGNQQAFVIIGTPADLAAFARRILDALPLVLTDDEQNYLTHICEMHGYDPDAGSKGRSATGWAWFLTDEDAMGYDLTNEQEREITYDD